MVKITKVYTRKGDTGTTTVLGKERISKTSKQIIALGALDEVNAYIGWTLVALNPNSTIHKRLLAIQNDLFDLGAYLCQPLNHYPQSLTVEVDQFEREIDQMNEALSTLNSFIFPGGSEVAARLHITRTVVRGCEIKLVSLSKETAVEKAIPYINRLSDWLFVAARYSNKEAGIFETLWQPASAKYD